MGTAKVLPECFPVFKIVRMWAAAIKCNPGAEESHTGMGCMNMIVGRLLIGKTTPTALHQAITVLGGGASFCLTVRVQVQGDVPPLNKICEMPSIPLRDWEPG